MAIRKVISRSIEDGSVTSADIANTTIAAADIANGTITSTQLAAGENALAAGPLTVSTSGTVNLTVNGDLTIV